MTRRLDAGWVAAALTAVTAVLGGLGAVDLLVTRLPAFGLDGEIIYSGDGQEGWGVRLPVIFSATVILCASLAALALSRADTATAAAPRLWRCLAGLFAFMAVDDLVTIHELLEAAVHFDWQLLYLPAAVAAGLLWSAVLFVLPGQRIRAPWIAGGACWLVAWLLEGIRWETDFGIAVWRQLTVSEEILEMAGSCTFLVALLLVLSKSSGRATRPLRSIAVPQRVPEPTPETALIP